MSIQTIIDQFLDIEQAAQIQSKLSQLRHSDYSLHQKVCHEIKSVFTNEPDHRINIKKLYLLQFVCAADQNVVAECFKTTSIYQLVAVTKGYLGKGQNVRGLFVRNLKRTGSFWGISAIQNIYNALNEKATPTISVSADLKSKEYLWKFIESNIEIFPPAYDIYEFALKHMLMLRTDKKQQLHVFNIIIDIFTKYHFSYQSLSKNFRFIIQFFRTSLSEKELGGYFPQLSALNIIKNYSNYQLDNMFAMGSLGLSWSNTDVLNCVTNVFKLGLTEQTYRLLKAIIEMLKNLKKYHQLIHAFEKNLNTIFIFLKYDQLYSASLKTLKEFILGPWAISTLYNIFAPKAVEFSKLKPLKQRQDFVIFLACVVDKYRESTLVNDLQQIVSENLSDGEISAELIRKTKLEYDWRVFENSKAGIKGQAENQEKTENRGIVNIGNSCYMNSFLQCLYMNKQLRNKILESSTLSVEKQVLVKEEQRFISIPNHGKNLALLARETVRPLGQIQRLFSLLLKSKRQQINPTNIRKISPLEFQNNFQHDSIEFGRFLIESLAKCFENLFEGVMIVEIECPFCGVKRNRKEQFLDLMISETEVQKVVETSEEQQNKKNIQNLEEMIRGSLKEEYVQGLTCEHCNNQQRMQEGFQQIIKNESSEIKQENGEPHKSRSIKRHIISKYPKYLILTMKRFEYDMKKSKNIKKQYKLDLQEFFKAGEAEYLLTSFIVHRGVSANSGHYYAFSRKSYAEDDKQWLCLNDTTVTKLSDLQKVKEFLNLNQQDTPYIIFGVEKSYWVENSKTMQKAITLRPPLQSFIEKDDSEYVKSLSKKGGGIDLSMLKFATGNMMKKDDDDDQLDGMGGFGNNPIM